MVIRKRRSTGEAGLRRICTSRDRQLSVTPPTAALQCPAIATLDPPMGFPAIAWPFADIVALVPNMPVAVPVPVARRPGITVARSGYDFDDRLRRSDADIDVPRLRHARCGQRAGRERGDDHHLANLDHETSCGFAPSRAPRFRRFARATRGRTVALPNRSSMRPRGAK